MDVLVSVDSKTDFLVTAIQMMHRGNVSSPALWHIVLHGAHNPNPISAENLPKTGASNSTIFDSFGVLDSQESMHPLEDKGPTRNFTVMNKGGTNLVAFLLVSIMVSN